MGGNRDRSEIEAGAWVESLRDRSKVEAGAWVDIRHVQDSCHPDSSEQQRLLHVLQPEPPATSRLLTVSAVAAPLSGVLVSTLCSCRHTVDCLAGSPLQLVAGHT
jgi:hypothetical protein